MEDLSFFFSYSLKQVLLIVTHVVILIIKVYIKQEIVVNLGVERFKQINYTFEAQQTNFNV
jgi:hypothetical protein